MICSTPGHKEIKATWTVVMENVILVTCVTCAEVGIKMGAKVRRIDD